MCLPLIVCLKSLRSLESLRTLNIKFCHTERSEVSQAKDLEILPIVRMARFAVIGQTRRSAPTKYAKKQTATVGAGSARPTTPADFH